MAGILPARPNSFQSIHPEPSTLTKGCPQTTILKETSRPLNQGTILIEQDQQTVQIPQEVSQNRLIR